MTFNGALLKLTTTQAITFPDVLTWHTAEYDTLSFWSAGAPSRITIPAGVSKVRLNTIVDFAPLAGIAWFTLRIFKNGSTYPLFGAQNSSRVQYGYTSNTVSAITAALDVVEGDYFEVRLDTSSASLSPMQPAISSFAVEVLDGYRGATVSLSSPVSATWPHTVSWDTEHTDTDNIFTPASPTRLTVPAGVSKVKLFGQGWFTSLASDRSIQVNIFKNGAIPSTFGRSRRVRLNNAGTDGFEYVVTPVIDVAPGDYFELVPQASTASVTGLQETGTWFEMQVIK